MPGYVNPNLTANNRTIYEDDLIAGRKSIVPLVHRAEKEYTAKTGQKCQKTFAPFRESCLVVKDGTTDAQLMDFKAKAEKALGWKCIGIWLHQDEGHAKSKYVEGDDGYAINHHAHMLWDCVDHETGKAIRATKSQLSVMQDLLAEATGMERGNRAAETGRAHRTAMQQRIHAEEQRIERLEAVAAQKNQDTKENLIDGLASLVGRGRKKTIEAQKAEISRLTGELQARDRIIGQMAQSAADAKKTHENDVFTITSERQSHDKTISDLKKEANKRILAAQKNGYQKGVDATYKIVEDLQKTMQGLKEDIRELIKWLANGDENLTEWYATPRKDRIFVCPMEQEYIRQQEQQQTKQQTEEGRARVETDKQSRDKMKNLLQYAKEYATREGLHTGERWLRDEFENYFAWHEREAKANRVMPFGGIDGSQFNREVLREIILDELGSGVGGQHAINAEEEQRLKAALDCIVYGNGQSRGVHR